MFNNLVLGKERGKLKKQLSALLSKKKNFWFLYHLQQNTSGSMLNQHIPLVSIPVTEEDYENLCSEIKLIENKLKIRL